MGQAARPVGGDKRDRSLPPGAGVARAHRFALFDHDETRPVLAVVLDRLRQHVQPVARGRGLAGDRGRAGLPLLGHRSRGARRVMKRDGADLTGVQVAVALRQRLRVRQRALHWTRPPEQAVPNRLHVLSHHAQPRQLPQQVGHLLDDARAAVLDRQHGGVDGAHREGVEGKAEGRKTEPLRVGKDRRDGLVRIRARLALVGDFHPKIKWRSVSATWL